MLITAEYAFLFFFSADMMYTAEEKLGFEAAVVALGEKGDKILLALIKVIEAVQIPFS